MNNKALRNRKKSTVDNDALVGSNGEVIIITDESTIAIHDGVNAGGTRLTKEDSNFTAVHKHADATQSVPGFMTAADKTKLDNLSAQALPAASSQNNPNTLVKRDANGDFSAGVITADLVGDVTGAASSLSGNLSGDVTSVGMVTTLSASGAAAGTYGSSTQVARVVVDSKGRVTNVQNVTIAGGGASGAAGGDLGGTYPNPTVETVGTKSKTAIAQAVVDTVNATSAGTASTLAKRDANGKLQTALTIVGDPSGTLATKSYVDAFSGGSKNVAVYRRNPSTAVQEVSVNGAAFSSSGATTFAVPASVGWFGLIAIGGGGGGAGASAANGMGGGGGGAAYIYAEGVPVTPGTSLTVSVGSGGTAGVGGVTPNGGNGGNTTLTGAGLFAGTITAHGAGGAVANSAGNSGSVLAGMNVVNNDGGGLKYNGGGMGTAGSGIWGGGGGCSLSGSSGQAGAYCLPGIGFGPGNGGTGGTKTTGVTAPGAGADAGVGGGGGGGGINLDIPSYANGGRGGHGLVVIFY